MLLIVGVTVGVILIVGVTVGVILILGVIDGVTLLGDILGVTCGGIHSGQSFFLIDHNVPASGPIPITLITCGSDEVFWKVSSTAPAQLDVLAVG